MDPGLYTNNPNHVKFHPSTDHLAGSRQISSPHCQVVERKQILAKREEGQTNIEHSDLKQQCVMKNYIHHHTDDKKDQKILESTGSQIKKRKHLDP